MRTIDLGFTKTKNHHRFGPRQHNTIADLGRNNTAQHNTKWMMIWFWFMKIQKNVNESNWKNGPWWWSETLPPMMIAPSSHQSTMKISPFLNKMNNTHYHLHHLHRHRRLHFHHHHHQTHFRVILAVRFHCLGPTTSSATIRFPGEASRRGDEVDWGWMKMEKLEKFCLGFLVSIF